MERFGSDGRFTAMVLFDAFQDALRDLMVKDATLLEQRASKATLAHRLAVHLQYRLRQRLNLSVDEASDFYLSLPGDLVLDIDIDKTDILLHDRKGTMTMSIMLYRNYITKAETEELKKRNQKGVLTLAVSFLPGKSYVLIYRVGGETIDYYHYDPTQNISLLKMQKDRGEEYDVGQLSLLKTRRRHKQ